MWTSAPSILLNTLSLLSAFWLLWSSIKLVQTSRDCAKKPRTSLFESQSSKLLTLPNGAINKAVIALLVGSLCFLAFFPAFAHASTYDGLSSHNIMSKKFDCDGFLNEVNAALRPTATAIWDSSFGGDKTCLTRFLDSNRNRAHAVVIYLDNGAGRRNRSLSAGDFFPGISVSDWNKLLESRNQLVRQAISDRHAAIRAYFEAFGYPTTQVILSPSLEDNLSPRAYDEFIGLLEQESYFTLMRNPEGGTRDKHLGLANVGEKHGSAAKCSGAYSMVNLDGSILSEKSAAKWYARNKHCWIRILWDAEGQGYVNGHKPKGPRSERGSKYHSYWSKILGAS